MNIQTKIAAMPKPKWEMSPDKEFRIESMRGRVSDAEWSNRVDLAACYRLMDLYDMSDLTAAHVSLRVDDEPDALLLNPHGMLYDEINASSLIKVDDDGRIIGRTSFGDYEYSFNYAGFVIHGAIHRADRNINCVIHTHTAAGMAISALECGLLPLNQTAMRFLNIGYHDFQGVAIDLAEQESLVADLDGNSAMILRNHGLIAVGGSVGEAFNTIHRLELACRTQLMTLACGTKVNPVPQPILDETYALFQPGTRRPFGQMEWPSMRRKLDRIDPSYRD